MRALRVQTAASVAFLLGVLREWIFILMALLVAAATGCCGVFVLRVSRDEPVKNRWEGGGVVAGTYRALIIVFFFLVSTSTTSERAATALTDPGMLSSRTLGPVLTLQRFLPTSTLAPQFGVRTSV